MCVGGERGGGTDGHNQTSEATARLQIHSRSQELWWENVNDYLQVGELREGLFTAWMDTSVRPVTCVDPET